MELNASRFDVETASPRRRASSSKRVHSGSDKANPRTRRINRSARANGFRDFSAEVLRELNPRGPLESVLADHVVASTWRLKAALSRQTARLATEDGADAGDSPSPSKTARSAADQAARSVREALELLECIRAGRDFEVEVETSALSDPIPAAEATGWPVVLDSTVVDDGADDETGAEGWGDRLVFDFEVSDSSPVVKGTWITVSHIVSLIVDGQTWADILRSHPELTEEDIRTCVAYAVAQDSGEV